MGKIIIDNTEYGYQGTSSICYVAERALSDIDGFEITKDYLLSSYDTSCNEVTMLEEQPNAGFHNSFYRGKNITDKITDESIWTTISSGEFTDLFVGDFFIINGHTYIIAGFNTYLNNGDTAFTSNHVVCVNGSSPIFNGKAIYTTDSTAGGYVGSWNGDDRAPMHDFIATDIPAAHFASFRELMSNSMSASVLNGPNPYLVGAASNWAWQSITDVIPTEIEFLGATLYSSSGYDIGTGKVQLPLFKFDKSLLRGRRIWTRSIADATDFVTIEDGEAAHQPATSKADFILRFCLI